MKDTTAVAIMVVGGFALVGLVCWIAHSAWPFVAMLGLAFFMFCT